MMSSSTTDVVFSPTTFPSLLVTFLIALSRPPFCWLISTVLDLVLYSHLPQHQTVPTMLAVGRSCRFHLVQVITRFHQSQREISTEHTLQTTVDHRQKFRRHVRTSREKHVTTTPRITKEPLPHINSCAVGC